MLNNFSVVIVTEFWIIVIDYIDLLTIASYFINTFVDGSISYQSFKWLTAKDYTAKDYTANLVS